MTQEIIKLRQENSKTYELGDGKRQLMASIGAVHYKDTNAQWQDIDADYSEPDSGAYTARFTRLSYVIRMGDNGLRRIYPDRNDLSYWIELGKPFASMGAPTKVGGYWTWNFTNAVIAVRVENGSVKFGFRLKNSQAPTSITIPFSSQGITRNGNELLHNGQAVSILRQPFARDANEVERDCQVSWASGSVTISLDTTGLTYPIDIDPTWQVGASSDDCRRDLTPSAWSLVSVAQYAGNFNITNKQYGGGMRFLNVTIPQASTISQAYLTLRCSFSYTGLIVRTRISAEDVDDAITFADDSAAFDTRWAARTTARVDWDSIPVWTVDVDYNSPEIKAVIQEVVDRAGWASGNDMVIFWDDFDNRSDNGASAYRPMRQGYSYDGSTTYAPKLVITYVPATTPVADGDLIGIAIIRKG